MLVPDLFDSSRTALIILVNSNVVVMWHVINASILLRRTVSGIDAHAAHSGGLDVHLIVSRNRCPVWQG